MMKFVTARALAVPRRCVRRRRSTDRRPRRSPSQRPTRRGCCPPSPPRCTTEQTDTGNVAGCVITLGPGMPENRGWPQPPFPEPENPTVIPWVDLAIGAVGTAVAKVQTALVNARAPRSRRRSVRFATPDGGEGVPDRERPAQHRHRRPGDGHPARGAEHHRWHIPADRMEVARLGLQRQRRAGRRSKQQLVGNAQQIGSMKPGSAAVVPGALPLFEGFYAEIQARGYVIGDGGELRVPLHREHSQGLRRAHPRQLSSNHAYGLAIRHQHRRRTR